MSDPFVAEIRIFPFAFAPRDWALCNGQLVPISQNPTLFSLLGTNYGGDGKSNFALPDLRGAAPMHAGGGNPGPGLSNHVIGEFGGSDTITLLTSQMPAHNHSLSASTAQGTTNTVQGGVLSEGTWATQTASGAMQYYKTAKPDTNLNPLAALSVAGSNFPHNNLMPYLTLSFCIALRGLYPSRP